ncbi:MAG: tetraacyldisaccharide 4'-kinase [Bacteroidales bacterium]|nr:tetraacyldisaccharide 4'-kinase [Bacteroidales bacterium]
MLGILSKTILFPYWLALKTRHFLYDKNIIKGREFDVPVVCVGNITVGGTGKTPHTEMLIRMLAGKYNIAVLSRGYRRKTKGFRIASVNDTFREVGDEPLQIKQKFPNVTVAVCSNRVEGIEKLLALPEGVKGEQQDSTKPELIILDDAYQHRKVKPSHSIVLINWSRPIFGDDLLPIGRLRDLPEQIKRANTVIVTKSPVAVETDGIIDEERTALAVKAEEAKWRRNLHLRDDQKLLFSIINYCAPQPVFNSIGDSRYIYSGKAIYFTGIANDAEFRNNLVRKYKILDSLKFADHKNFSRLDVRQINSWASKNPTAVIFTTEKDSKRLLQCSALSQSVKSRLFYIPIETVIV